jgi:hypothetical protein
MPASKLTPEQMKAEILRLAKPLDDFTREHGITSFSLDNGDKKDCGTFDISLYRHPVPPRIKCALKEYGCIYVEDKDGK